MIGTMRWLVVWRFGVSEAGCGNLQGDGMRKTGAVFHGGGDVGDFCSAKE